MSKNGRKSGSAKKEGGKKRNPFQAKLWASSCLSALFLPTFFSQKRNYFLQFLSFLQSESGGTVLSTNWNEIGDKKTEVKPPDGMEYKKWEY